MALELASTYISVGLNADGLQKAIQKDFSAAGKDASKSFGRGFNPEKESRGPLGKLGKGLINVGKVGAGAVGLIGAAVGGLALHGGIDRALNIEKAQAKLKGLGHDTKSVDAIMKNALASVKGTAFGMGEAATTAAGAVAAGIKPGQDLERMLKGVANSAAAAGIGMDEMGSIWNKVATSDMAQMDVLNQVADRGIPIYQALAEEMGVTAGEVRKLASSGKVNFATFEKAMTNASGTVASEMGNTVTGKIDNAKAALSRLGETAVSQFMPMFSGGIDGATAAIDGMGPAVESASKWAAREFGRLATSASSAFTAIKGSFENSSIDFSAIGRSIGSTLGPVLTGVSELVAKVGNALGRIAKAVLPTVRDGFAKIAPSVKGLVDAFQPLLQAIGHVVDLVAPVLIPVFKLLATVLMGAVKGAIDGITLVVKGLTNVFNGIVDFVKNVFAGNWRGAWDGIKKIVTGAIQVIGGAIWTWLNVTVAGAIRGGMLKLTSLFRGGWSSIQGVFTTALNFLKNAVSGAWTAVKSNSSAIWNGIKNLISGAWGAIKSTTSSVANSIKTTVINVFSALSKGVSGIWNGIKSTASTVWSGIKSVIQGAVDGLKVGVLRAFEATKTGITNIWNGIKSAAAKPVNFIIETVWNNGLRKAMNLIPGVNLATAKPIAGYREGGYTGRMHPDHVAGIVHGNEYVLTSEETNKLGGPRGVEAWKRAALERGYRSGGSVKPVRASHSGWKGGKYRSGKWHGGLDFPARTGTPIYAMWDGIVSLAKALNRSYGHHVKIDHGGGVQTLYAHMSRIMTSVGKQVKAGQQIGAVGSTGNSTGPHLHLEVRKGGKQVNPEPYLSGAKLPKGGIAGAIEAGWEFITKVPSMFNDVRKNLGSLTGPWGDIAKKAATHAVDKAWGWAKGKLNPFSGDDGSGFKYSAGGKVERWRPLVLRALAHVGQPASLADTTLRRLNQESGGNPKAINLWDTNAKMGTPSKGLMQVIGPTFRAYRDKSLPNNIWDPMANIVASMRYAKSRYGSLSAAYSKRGGYWTGTPSAAPGLHWVGERGPELVDFRGGERVWSNSDSVRMASGGSQGSTIHVHNLHLPDGVETAIDLVRELERLPLRAHMQGVA